MEIAGTHAAIDGHSLIENGYYNVHCLKTGDDDLKAGLQIKDSEIVQSVSDGFYLACPNIRLIGDLITGNGTDPSTFGAGVHFLGEELTVADGVIEQSADTGLDLIGAAKVSVSAMFFDDNGDEYRLAQV